MDEILKNYSIPVIDFSSIELSTDDFERLKSSLNKNVHYIKWHEKQLIPTDLKAQIQKKLIENILADRKNHPVIDLTKFELDAEFIGHLSEALHPHPGDIGAVILSETDEERFGEDPNYKRILETLARNNATYQRFPSDYAHALLTCHCNNDTNQEVTRKLTKLGWQVSKKSVTRDASQKGSNEHASKSHTSILYKNESTRQLVLAFCGLKIDPKDFFVEKNQLEAALQGTLSNEITAHSYYAFNHSREALKMSQEMGFYLSFTGFAFGAWLAEQSVYFCHQEWPAVSVRAVTFESPGSWDIIEHMHESRLSNNSRKTINADLARHMDVKTYLFAPNFLNTCNRHVGRVYRVVERPKDATNFFDQLVRGKILASIKTKFVRNRIDKWYTTRVRPQMAKFDFILNGLRALFARDLTWLLDEFDIDNESSSSVVSDLRFRPSAVSEVLCWPRVDFLPTSSSCNFDLRISTSRGASNRVSENLRMLLGKPFGWVLDLTIKRLVEKSITGLILITNIVFQFIVYSSNVSDSLLQNIAFDDQNNDEYTASGQKAIDAHADGQRTSRRDGAASEASFLMKFKGKYETRPLNEHSDYLWLLDPFLVDSRLYDFYYDDDELDRALAPNRCYGGNHLSEQFRLLREAFELIKEGEERTLVRIESSTFTIEQIRERFMRLEKIKMICLEKSIRLRKSAAILPRTKTADEPKKSYAPNSKTYVRLKKDEEMFSKLSEILDKHGYAYIYGHLGNGKTTLSHEYAHRVWVEKNRMVQFFHSSEDISSNMTQLCHRFLTKDEMDSAKNGHELIRLIKNKLDSLAKPVLFVFDNVNSIGEIEFILDTLSANKFLITTKRHKIFEKKDPNRECGIKKKPFDRDDYFQYLEQVGVELGGQKRAEWESIVDKCVETNVSIKDFENGINYYRNHLFCTFDDVYRFIKNESFEKYDMVRKENPIAYEILTHLAYLHRDYIDLEVVKILVATVDSVDVLMVSIEYLANNGFVKIRNQDEWQIEIHASIQNQVKERLSYINMIDQTVTELIQKITDRIRVEEKARLTEASESNTKSISRELVDKLSHHVMSIDRECTRAHRNAAFSNLIYLMAEVNEKWFENYEQAIGLLKIEIKNKSERASNRPELGKVLLKIADIFATINRRSLFVYKEQFEDALRFYNMLIEIKRREIPVDEQLIADTLFNIGVVLNVQDKLDEALEFFNEALELNRRQSRVSEPRLVDTLNRIAKIQVIQQKFEAALSYLYEALEIQRRQLPMSVESIGESLNEIGHVLESLAKYDEAQKFFQESVEMQTTWEKQQNM